MNEQLYNDLHNAAYETEEIIEGTPMTFKVVDLPVIDSLLSKHNFLKLGDLLNIISSSQMVALKSGTTLFRYDFIGTAGDALNWGIQDSFKNISDKPFDMSVARIDVQKGLHVFTDMNGKEIDVPTIAILLH